MKKPGIISRVRSLKLTSAEGASGSHANAIQEAYEDFLALAKTITADTELI